jgi:hypothetical protein
LFLSPSWLKTIGPFQRTPGTRHPRLSLRKPSETQGRCFEHRKAAFLLHNVVQFLESGLSK